MYLHLLNESFTVKHNPIAGVNILEIFEAQHYEGRRLYPVIIDGYYIMFEKLDSQEWIKKGMGFIFSPEVIAYVTGLLDEHEDSLG